MTTKTISDKQIGHRDFQVKVTASVLLIMISLILAACDGYNILVVFPNPSRSHGNLGDGLVRHLLKAGHRVTYITPFAQDPPQQNLSYIDVSSTRGAFTVNPYALEELMNKKTELDQHRIFHLMKKVSELTFENDNLKNFLEHTNETFDVVIAEWLFNELYSGFAAVFNCPYIWVFPFERNFLALSLIDEATNPSYTANFEMKLEPPFTFTERIRNLWFQITYGLRHYFFYDALEKEIFRKVFEPILMKKNGYLVPYDELRYNASLMLTYSHNSLGQSLKIPQNIIPVGGYHINDDIPPLPEDLRKIMDNAQEGVIYFSMGSNLKSKDFPNHFLRSLINIFAHPNCVLFITHGGLLSVTEAVHFGVPIIGIPVFYDQYNNVDRAVMRGFAKKIILNHDFPINLKAAIEDILDNVKYAVKAKELSLIYHDRPVPPGTALVHWVQHVVATHGAPHLRSPALLLPWYQKHYIDLVAVVIFSAGVVYRLLKLLVGCRENRADILRKKMA